MLQRMDRLLSIALLLMVGYVGVAKASNPCPEPDDALEQLLIQETETERHDLMQTAKLETNEKGTIDAAVLASDLSMERIQSAVDEIPADIKAVGDQDSGVAASQDIALPYYHRICPHYWYLIRRYQWYWRVRTISDDTTIIDYWFTYWWVWGTWCPQRYCSVYYNPFQSLWDPRYKCYPEYRVVWLPMRCYRWIIQNGVGTGQWVTWQWRRVYVPRGCCCRRYWFWLTANTDTCPVADARAAP